ncbi:BNR-4 repeat-containing protein [Candidatus Dojkabacteria bacterium]|jgi:hypothetical protein|nr:BNR-4 repeat-containing protein [Candidatus Dojkabacteria bacterium]
MAVAYMYPVSDWNTRVWTTTPLWSKLNAPYSTPNDTSYIIDNVSAVSSFSCYLSATICNTWPKSCGYDGLTLYFRGRKQAAAVFQMSMGVILRDGSTWSEPSAGTAVLTTTFTTYTQALSVASDRYGSINRLVGIPIRARKHTNVGKAYVSEIGMYFNIYYDDTAPSAPASITVSGLQLFDGIVDTSDGTPILGFKYEDSTSASYGDYDETSKMGVVVGSGYSGGEITNVCWATNKSVVASLTSASGAFVTIAYASSTPLSLDTVYYVKGKFWDANDNEGSWSAVGTFRYVASTAPDDWWNSAWTRRAEIVFPTPHGTLCPGYTVGFVFNSGNIKTLATNGHANEAIGPSAQNGIMRRGDKTYICWRTQEDAKAYISYYNHTTGTFGPQTSICDLPDWDSHYYPSMNMDSEGYIYIVNSGHNSPQYVYVSDATYDITSFTQRTSVDDGTYPRILIDSSDNLTVFYRYEYVAGDDAPAEDGSINYCECFQESDDGGVTWGERQHVAAYFGSIYVPKRGVYCGGVCTDKSGRYYMVITFTELLGDTYGNYHRGIGCYYSDDKITWKNLDGSIAGTTTEGMSTHNITYDKTNLIFNAPYMTNSPIATTGPYYTDNGAGLRVTDNGTIIFCIAKLAATQPGNNFINLPCDQMVAISQPGSVWATFSMFNEVGVKPWKHRHAGGLQIYRSENYENTIIDIFAIFKQEGDSYFAGELGVFRTYNYGENWSFKYLTRNSGYGIPMISCVPSCYNTPELAFTRGYNVDYWDGTSPGTTFLVTGDDVRVVFGTHQIDRIAKNFWNYNQTEMQFAMQSTIATTDIRGGDSYKDKYWLYYGNYFASATPPSDPNNVYRFFEGFELYPVYTAPDEDGWDSSDYGVVSVRTTFGTTVSPQPHTNKVWSGDKSLWIDGGGRIKRTIPTLSTLVGNYFEMEFAQWGNGANDIYLKLNLDDATAVPTVKNYSFEEGAFFDPDYWSAISGNVYQISMEDYLYGCRDGLGAYRFSLMQAAQSWATSATFSMVTDVPIRYNIFLCPSINYYTWLVKRDIGHFYMQLYDTSNNKLAHGTFSFNVPDVGWSNFFINYTSTSTTVFWLKIGCPTYWVLPTVANGNFEVSPLSAHWTTVKGTPTISSVFKYSGSKSLFLNNYNKTCSVKGGSSSFPTAIPSLMFNFYVYGSLSKLNTDQRLIVERHSSAVLDLASSSMHLDISNGGWTEATFRCGYEIGSDIPNILKFILPTFDASSYNPIVSDGTLERNWAGMVTDGWYALCTVGSPTFVDDAVAVWGDHSLKLDCIYHMGGYSQLCKVRTDTFSVPTGIDIRYFVSLKRSKNTNSRVTFSLLNTSNTALDNTYIDESLLSKTAFTKFYIDYKSTATTVLKLQVLASWPIYGVATVYLYIDNIYASIMNEYSGVYIDKINYASGTANQAIYVDYLITEGNRTFEIYGGENAYYRFGDSNEWLYTNLVPLNSSQYHYWNCVFGTQIRVTVDGDLAIAVPGTTWKGGYSFATFKFGNSKTQFLDHILIKDWIPLPPTPEATLFEYSDLLGQVQVSNLVSPAYIRGSRVAGEVIGEKTSAQNIAQLVIGEYSASRRIANAMTVERTSKDTLAQILSVDKHLSSRVAHYMNVMRVGTRRVASKLKMEKKVFQEMSNILLGDKEVVARLSNRLRINKEEAVRICCFVDTDKQVSRRIANDLSGDKELVNRIASHLSTDKEVVEEISNIINGDKIVKSMIASRLLGDKEFVEKVASIIVGDKELVERINNKVNIEQTEKRRIATYLNLDKEVSAKVSNEFYGDKKLVESLANRISFDKGIVVRVVNKLVLDKISKQEVANLILADKNSVFRLAMKLTNDKGLSTEIANKVILEDIVYARVSNYVILSKFLTKQVSNILRVDKEFISQISNIVRFADVYLKYIPETVDYEAEREERLTETVSMLAVKLVGMVQTLLSEKDSTRHISEVVEFDKLLADLKIAQFIDFSAVRIGMFSEDSLFIKDFYKKVVETIQLQAENTDNRYAQLVDYVKNEMQRFAEDILFMSTKIKSIAQSVNFLAETVSLARIVELMFFSKEQIYTIAEKCGLNKEVTDAIVAEVSFNRYKEASVSEVVGLSKEEQGYIVEKFDLNKQKQTRFVSLVMLQRAILEGFSQTLDLSRGSVEKITEQILFRKGSQADIVGFVSFVATNRAAINSVVTLVATSTGRVVGDIFMEKSSFGAVDEAANFVANKFSKYSQFVTLLSTNLYRTTETTAFSKDSISSFSGYVSFIAEELLMKRLSEFIEFFKDKTTNIVEYVILLKLYLPELILADNFIVKKSTISNLSINSGSIPGLEII